MLDQVAGAQVVVDQVAGTQVVVDQVASLSVTFPYFMCNPPYTRYLSILFLNIILLTLQACTHSSDNLFHTLMVLCENENFLTSNL